MRCLTLGFLMAAVIGCKGIEPVGPLAGMWGKDSPNASAKPSKEKKSKDGPPPPVTVPAVKPTPPLSYIYPDDVEPENVHEAVQKLRNELEAEGKNIPAPPVTAEVSRYKGGVKQK